MNFINNYKKYLIIFTGILTLIVGIVYYYSKNTEDGEKIELNELIINSTLNEEVNNQNNTKVSKIKVHISGEVLSPGVIEIEEGARLIDAIKIAGGLTENANVNKVNLACVLEDAIKIHIPSFEEGEENMDIVSNNNGEDNAKLTININTATAQELTKINGIGSSIANKIINYRKENGKFTSIEELMQVNGIGKSKYDEIKKYIYVK